MCRSSACGCPNYSCSVASLPLLRRQGTAPPVRILQFGTGRFLRAFADFFVDQAIQAGHYDGSIAAIQSTGAQRASTLTQQDGCYTLWARDQGGETYPVIGAISQALAAQQDWDTVLDLARSPHLEMVFSNTTEIGLALHPEDDVYGNPPHSFPAKLAAVLYERAQHFNFDPTRGLVILPCELITDNGDLLRSLVVSLAENQISNPDFLPWLGHSTVFCNTLVDRIVPGAPPESEYRAVEQRLGYRDDMLVTAEAYRLWAIEGDSALNARIGFTEADPGIVVTEDIAPYRLRKIRLLNGGHTLSVPLGLLAGNHTVLDNMSNPSTATFIKSLLRYEIGPCLAVDQDTVPPYITEVLQRWSNPHLMHRLIDITLQSTTKMRHRVVPSIVAYYDRFQTPPVLMALGFAAYLLMMRGLQEADESPRWPVFSIRDDYAPKLHALWEKSSGLEELVAIVCRDTQLWGIDLSNLNGWVDAVSALLKVLMEDGTATAIGHIEDRLS